MDQLLHHPNRKLHSLLQRCREKGIKLNKDKLKLKQKKVTFMGHVISAEGLKPDPMKIEAVLSMPTPTNKQDIRRLRGMVNYLQKLSPNLSDITAPLLKRTSPIGHNVSMEPTSTRYIFPSPKDSTAPLLKFFNATQEVELQCDVSEKGLGACLLQQGQLFSYASRSFMPTKSSSKRKGNAGHSLWNSEVRTIHIRMPYKGGDRPQAS